MGVGLAGADFRYQERGVRVMAGQSSIKFRQIFQVDEAHHSGIATQPDEDSGNPRWIELPATRPATTCSNGYWLRSTKFRLLASRQ